MKVQLTVYRDHLVVTTRDPEQDYPGWTPSGPGRIGCVLTRTATSLGASEEALKWLRAVPRSRDAIGTVDWFATQDEGKAFAWMGGPLAIFDRELAEGSRTYAVYPNDCVRIANDPPADACEYLDGELGPVLAT